MIKVAVAGKFDPFPHRGHIEHFREAKKQGDYLIVITHPDNVIGRVKGVCFTPLEDRIAMLKAIRYVDEVVVSIDGNGESAQTLRKIKPNIFCKGGDRTPDNMPQSELDVCSKIGCEIRYGIQGVIRSNSEFIKQLKKEGWLC